MFLADSKRSGNPCRFSPAEQIQRNIWIDGFGICCKLKPCSTGHICPFFGGSLGCRFCSARRIDIRTQFQLDMRQANPIIFLKQQPHDFFVFFWMFNFIIQQQTRGIIRRNTAQPTICGSRIFVCLCPVCDNLHGCNAGFSGDF